MKRSEMIKNITDYLKSETGFEQSKSLAVTILDMCEDAGMLPPFSCHYDGDGFVKYSGNRWEAEEEGRKNETKQSI